MIDSWGEKGVFIYEDAISAEEEIQSEGSRIPCENEHEGRKKGPRCQKSKGQKSDRRLSFGFIV